ncbi:hypothetical protein AACH06_01750 [Ideonella sp. DXS29W]|uniref:Uncharacterized protein n=1 Tax=Ideonella lacteola TaxID=2984193 RepID=A0ABU9BHW0_9BURK
MNLTLRPDPVELISRPAHLAGWVLSGLLLLALAACGLCLDLMPTFRLQPIDVLPVVIALQVLGAVALTGWLLWSPA